MFKQHDPQAHSDTTTSHLQGSLQLDENGLLQHPQQWTTEVAGQLAQKLNLAPLTDEHWCVINDMREHYQRFSVVPPIHNICHKHGQDEFWVAHLFNNSLNAWRVAGLPDPGEEARTYLNDM